MGIGGHLNGFRRNRRSLFQCYPTVAGHRLQYHIAARLRGCGMLGWREPHWPLNHSGNRCRFRERQVFQLLAKVDSRRLFNAAHSHCTSLSEIDFIAIEREDVFLRESLLQGIRQHCFCILPSQRALRSQVGVLNKLLSNR